MSGPLSKGSRVLGLLLLSSLLVMTGCDKPAQTRGLSPERKFSAPHHPPLEIMARQPSAPVAVLVIGVSDYQYEPDLQNAANDARLIAAAFQAIDINVIPYIDETAETLSRAIERFRQRLAKTPGIIGVVYFAGHGFTYDGQTWLAARDLGMDKQREILKSTGAITRDHIKGVIPSFGTEPGIDDSTIPAALFPSILFFNARAKRQVICCFF